MTRDGVHPWTAEEVASVRSAMLLSLALHGPVKKGVGSARAAVVTRLAEELNRSRCSVADRMELLTRQILGGLCHQDH